MRVIVAGSRTVNTYDLVERCINRALELQKHICLTEIVSGNARGVDRFGERYAKEHKLLIKIFPADWDRDGKSAGYKRNVQMARYSDALIAIWDGKSRGTAHMIDIAREQELISIIIRVN